MRRKIAIHAPIIGLNVHTYLRREIELLHAEHDVVVTCVAELTDGWTCPCPVLSAARLPASELRIPGDWSGVVTNYTVLPDEARLQFARMLADGTVAGYLRTHQIEGVFAQWLDDSLPLLTLSEELGLPYIVRTHGTDIAAGILQEQTRTTYGAYARARAVLVGSHYARTLMPRCGIPDAVTRVAPFGVEVPAWQASPGQRGDRINILALGRIELVKGVIFSLVGFKHVADQDDRVFLHVAGSGTILPAVRQMVQALGLEDRVKLWGFLPNDGPALRDLMMSADVFVQSSVVVPTESSIETFCMGAHEAMAAGIAVVVSDSQALPELTAGGTCGVIVPEADSAALGRALLALVRDPDRMRELGARARQRVVEHHSLAMHRDHIISALFGATSSGLA